MESLLAVILCLLGAAVVAGGIFFYLRRRHPVEQETYYRCHCPSCNRKLKYKASRGGHRGICPGCKKTLAFPMFPGEQAYLEEDAGEEA